MRTSERDEQFRQYVQAARPKLLRTARLLTAGDHHLAEDLVQSTLTKVYLKWPAFRRATNRGGYVYRIMVNTLTDHHRRPGRRWERPAAAVPDGPAPEPALDRESVDELMAALTALPPRMRAVLVLRYLHDLDVTATADAMGCSPGTVKSQTSRALDLLRAALTRHPLHV